MICAVIIPASPPLCIAHLPRPFSTIILLLRCFLIRPAWSSFLFALPMVPLHAPEQSSSMYLGHWDV
jgi:hypothetical protein